MREAEVPLLPFDTREPFLLKMSKDFTYFLSITQPVPSLDTMWP